MQALLTGISTILNNEFGSTFKKYYIGKPNLNRINIVDCPMLAIYPINTAYDDEATGTVKDGNNFQIGVELIDSARTYYGDSNSQTANASLTQFLSWIEKRDSDGDYDTPSILYALRTHSNLDLNSYSLFTDGFEIDYTNIAEDEDNDVISATLTFRASTRASRNLN